MFFKQRADILFRNYESFGYITDNRNFGYKQTNNNENNIGDKIVSQSGAVFLSVLDREPQTLDELAQKIIKQFIDVSIKTIKNDAKEFYGMLEQEGFIVSGETFQECNEKDIRFSYKALSLKMTQKNLSSVTKHPKKSTQEYLEEYFKNKPQLTSLHIEITNKCNEKCVHCYIPHKNKAGNIEPDLFYDILKQCKKMNLLHLTLSGGEPMAHKSFCNFLKKCKEYDFSINILSNLTLLNDEIIAEMKTNRLLGVQTSLYSMNPIIHDEITRIKGSFKKTKNAILKLIDNDIPLQISCPIMKQNKNCYDDVVRWARNYSIYVGNDYAILARYNHTTQNLSNRLSINEVEEVVNNIIANDAEYLKQMEAEVERKKSIVPNDIVCSVCRSSLCIADNGNVYPCVSWQSYVVGNVKQTPLKEIWDNSEKIQCLRQLQRKDFPKCIQCPEKDFCTMCMVRNANEHPQGDPLVVNEYFCKVAKLNKKIILDRKGL